MADSTIDSELFWLHDNWPGVPLEQLSAPTDGFTGSTHHNVAAAAYRIGDKIQVYQDGVSAGEPGYSTFIYLQVGTQNADSVIAVKTLCVPDSATNWYKVTNDPDSCIDIPGGAAAIALSAITDAYYGWFWCGGVCPEEAVSGLGGNYATTNAVAAGAFIAEDLSADAIGFGLKDAAGDVAIGFALAADA